MEFFSSQIVCESVVVYKISPLNEINISLIESLQSDFGSSLFNFSGGITLLYPTNDFTHRMKYGTDIFVLF